MRRWERGGTWEQGASAAPALALAQSTTKAKYLVPSITQLAIYERHGRAAVQVRLEVVEPPCHGGIAETGIVY